MSAFLPRFLEVDVPWAMRHRWRSGQRYTGNPTDFYSLWLFLEGEAHVQMGGQEWCIREGMAFLTPPNQFKVIHTPKGAEWLSLNLKATLFGQVDLVQLMWPPALWTPVDQDRVELETAMSAMVREWAGPTSESEVTPETVDQYVMYHWKVAPRQDAASLLLFDCYARAVVTLCWRMLGKMELEQVSGQGIPPWMQTVLEELHRDPDISIEQLARDIGISPTQLRRQFQKWFGASPREYLNRLRLEEARQLLQNTEMSAGEIAERIGFLSTPHFTRLFKQAYGLPPAQYRQLTRMSEG